MITFDDGYADFYHAAFPLLNRFGFTAVVFLPSSFIGQRALRFKGKECLTWSQVRELQGLGVCFGSHTVNHPQLYQLEARKIDYEIVKSKETIEQNTGRAITSFAYPFAFPQTDTSFTHRIRQALQLAGYQNGVCTIVGRANVKSDPYFLERLPINSCDDPALFAAKLAGAYDWAGKLQYAAKSVKSQLRKASWQKNK